MHRYEHRYEHGPRPGREVDVRRGDLLLVDGAGMPGTRLLDTAREVAAERGAVVRLLSDYRQLAAVETRATKTAGPAEKLVAALDSRGQPPGEEAALLLVQYVLAWGEFPRGRSAPARLRQTGLQTRAPAGNTMTAAVAAYLRGEDSAAFATLQAADDGAVRGAMRLLFVVAARSGGQLSPAQIDVLLAEVCRGVL